MNCGDLIIQIKTLTPIWTGGVYGNCDRLHETGIIGSMRWWYEAIVRGLGGYACDPTGDGACKLSGKEKNEEDRKAELCPVCYLFGCTGWQRKFRLEIFEDINGKPGKRKTTKINGNDKLWFKITQIKALTNEESHLILKMIEIASTYGAIGGKTIFKPSEEISKNETKLHHYDFGLFTLLSKSDTEFVPVDQIKRYLNDQFVKDKRNDPEWPDFRFFWFAKGKILNRKVHNQVVNRIESDPSKYAPAASDLQRWLGGKQTVSKKIFAFHTSNYERTWGYTKSNQDQYAKVLMIIKEKTGWEMQTVRSGEEILNEFFKNVL